MNFSKTEKNKEQIYIYNLFLAKMRSLSEVEFVANMSQMFYIAILSMW